MTSALPRLHGLPGIPALTPEQVRAILDRADVHAGNIRRGIGKTDTLRGRTQINLFAENSTRTRTSFELAGKRLGADVLNMPFAESSVGKGETLLDTAIALDAMRPDILVVRYPLAGVAALFARKIRCPVINAGDGCCEHPTQALLDALTIRRHKQEFQGLVVAICGDILHSRVARSNMLLLAMMGAHVRVTGPPTLIPEGIGEYGVTPCRRLEEAIRDADIIIMLRLQRERMTEAFIPSHREYFRYYGLTPEKLVHARPDVLVMHPGPMNRGVEIDSRVADDISHSVIGEQVEMGVAVRMAVLESMYTPAGNPERITA